MPINFELDKMSTSEKLELMERLWENLSRTPENIPSPEWHREEILRREKTLEAGEEQLLDWDEVKKSFTPATN